MSMVIASLLFVFLLAVALAHLTWALGRTWPIRDEKLLARTVTGIRGAERMPPRLLSLAVAALALVAGIIALALADPLAGGPLLSALGILAALLFFGRGAVGYTAWWARLTPEEPFRTLDRRNYSPLCLALGLGFIILAILRVT